MTKSVTTAVKRGSPLLRWLLLSFATGISVAFAQVVGTTNTLDNVAYGTGMWSLADPFAFGTLSNTLDRVAAVESYTTTNAFVTAAQLNAAVAEAITPALTNVIRATEYEPGKYRLFTAD